MTEQRDPGLQPERTELAWRRTLLALAAGALISLRVLPPVLGVAAVAAGFAGVAVAAGIWLAARRRHSAVLRVFRGEAPSTGMPGGGLIALLAAFVMVGAALALLGALLHA